MENIYDYISVSLQTPDTAMSQYDRIADAMMSLEMMPNRMKVMDSAPKYSSDLRRMLVDNHSIFFIIQNDTVIVTKVLYSAADIQNRLQ